MVIFSCGLNLSAFSFSKPFTPKQVLISKKTQSGRVLEIIDFKSRQKLKAIPLPNDIFSNITIIAGLKPNLFSIREAFGPNPEYLLNLSTEKITQHQNKIQLQFFSTLTIKYSTILYCVYVKGRVEFWTRPNVLRKKGRKAEKTVMSKAASAAVNQNIAGRRADIIAVRLF